MCIVYLFPWKFVCTRSLSSSFLWTLRGSPWWPFDTPCVHLNQAICIEYIIKTAWSSSWPGRWVIGYGHLWPRPFYHGAQCGFCLYTPYVNSNFLVDKHQNIVIYAVFMHINMTSVTMAGIHNCLNLTKAWNYLSSFTLVAWKNVYKVLNTNRQRWPEYVTLKCICGNTGTRFF